MLLHVFDELFDKCRHVFHVVWSVSHELEAKPRRADELAFLPTALELQDSPPHPAARVTMLALLGFITLAILWACFGKIDIVAVAPSKLIVSYQSKTIQSLDPGVVKAIHVRDGQVVRAGQLLIELDSTVSGAESLKNHDAWQDARLDTLRATSLINALQRNQAPVLGDDASIELLPSISLRRSATQQEMLSSWQELQAKRATVTADTARKQAERNGVQDQVRKLEQTQPIMRQRETDYQDLVVKNFMSKHGLLDKQQARIKIKQDLTSQRNKLLELNAGISDNNQQAAAIKAEFVRIQNEAFARANERAAALGQNVVKADQLQTQTRLTVLVDGVVQQLEAQTVLENKDISFINAGQAAAVKIETFNYTKYGLIDGQVSNVSLDAIPDEKLGLVYQAKVKLKQSKMNIEGQLVSLAPSMAVNVEVKTG